MAKVLPPFLPRLLLARKALRLAGKPRSQTRPQLGVKVSRLQELPAMPGAATAEALAALPQDATVWGALYYYLTTGITAISPTIARRVPKYFLTRKLELNAHIFF
jgi:hypothetical protein